ncbi:MAG: Holliday junction branch migration protein RuvA [Moraxellaceae bacterium]|nr:MAG: Holliday junction branch migration protein RuvA [Moraxellaceae bacterium]
MIARITGILIEKKAPFLVLDVQGVGYELQAPMTTFYTLPEVNQKVLLHTHFVVREDAQLLFGFAELRERDLFRFLIKVNGVGPKLALAILSGMEANVFVQCVQNNDANALVRLPGIGKKTAERLLIEMRDRIGDWDLSSGGGSAEQGEAQSASPVAQDFRKEAESALVALGYKAHEASRAIAAVKEAGASTETLIRAALQNMLK